MSDINNVVTWTFFNYFSTIMYSWKGYFLFSYFTLSRVHKRIEPTQVFRDPNTKKICQMHDDENDTRASDKIFNYFRAFFKRREKTWKIMLWKVYFYFSGCSYTRVFFETFCLLLLPESSTAPILTEPDIP